MHRCAVHKLTHWHIRQLSNTMGAVTIKSTITRTWYIIYMYTCVYIGQVLVFDPKVLGTEHFFYLKENC